MVQLLTSLFVLKTQRNLTLLVMIVLIPWIQTTSIVSLRDSWMISPLRVVVTTTIIIITMDIVTHHIDFLIIRAHALAFMVRMVTCTKITIDCCCIVNYLVATLQLSWTKQLFDWLILRKPQHYVSPRASSLVLFGWPLQFIVTHLIKQSHCIFSTFIYDISSCSGI